MAVSSTAPRRPDGRWLAAALVALAGVAFALLFVRIEWVEQEIDTGYAQDALRNPFLAAERFLQRHGVEAESVKGLALLDHLPPTGDLILISSSREAMSRRRRDALREWVSVGGSLAVVASEPWDREKGSSRDPLLDALGVHLVEAPAGDDEHPSEGAGADQDAAGADPDATHAAGDEATAAQPAVPDGEPPSIQQLIEEASQGSFDTACHVDESLTTTLPLASGEELRAALWGWRHLVTDDTGALVSGGPQPGQIVRVAIGSGSVTAATSLQLFTNPQIACFDHAYLLWLLAGDLRKVWLVHDPDVPSLASLIWQAFPMTLLGAGMWLATGLGLVSLRFGVAPRDGETQRRELLEHLEASAHFLWSHQSLHPLLERLRDDLRRRGAKADGPLPPRLGRRELIQLANQLLIQRRTR